MSKPRSIAELRNTVRTFRDQQTAKKAADAGAPKDPTDAGTVAIPKQPDAEDPNKIGVPASGKNPTTDTDRAALLTEKTNPAQSGSGTVPSTADGTGADAAATAALAKSAALKTKMASLLAAAKTQLATGAAPAPAQTDAEKAAAAAAASAQPVADPAALTEDAVKQASEFFRNIGEMLCGTEEGRVLVRDTLIKKAGDEQALNMIKEAAWASDVYAQLGAFQQEQMAKQAAEDEFFKEALAQLSPQEQATLVKMASIQEQDAKLFQSPDDAWWYAKGAAAMQEALPPEGAAMPEDMSQMAMPGGDGMPPPEELAQIIQMLVESGKLTPEQAEQLIQELMAEGGGAPPEGGMPPEGGAPPPMAEDPAAKAAAQALGCDDDIVALPAV